MGQLLDTIQRNIKVNSVMLRIVILQGPFFFGCVNKLHTRAKTKSLDMTGSALPTSMKASHTEQTSHGLQKFWL